MTCCNHCQDAGNLFGHRAARRDLRRYRSRGPSASTQLLLEALLSQGSDDHTLLDIGGGVGAIPLALLQAGYRQAVQVDASRSYLAAAEAEAARRGIHDRITYRFGDFVDVAAQIEMADTVTLDRVICCYPDLARLVSVSAVKARYLYGLVYPRARWATRAATSLANLWFRLRGSAFRTYLHPADRVEELLQAQGFRRIHSARTFFWQVATYARA